MMRSIAGHIVSVAKTAVPHAFPFRILCLAFLLNLSFLLAHWSIPQAVHSTTPVDKNSFVFMMDFDHSPPGAYDRATFARDWNDSRFKSGIQEGRAAVVNGPQADQGRSLRLCIKAGGYNSPAGITWPLELGPQGSLKSFPELYCFFRLRLGDNFQFVKGGKLPGFAGGKRNTGGKKPNAKDGWSARMMWRRNGQVVQYVYHADQPGPYGQDFPWKRDGQNIFFKPGVWYRIEQRVKMNTPGVHDGIIQCWLDGRLVLDQHNLRFRDVPDFSIDALLFHFFFGGHDPSWSPLKDECVFFDDVVVSTTPIGKQ